jgi:RNA polymerase sigma factor (sigma-70 family)
MDERPATQKSDESSLEQLARLAIDGDRGALDVVVRELQSRVYHLALRMLWNREDAEDATQEILVRIVTRLSQFDFRSRLHTWAFRVAVNYILDVKKSATERLHLSFERFADTLTAGLDLEVDADAEHSLLIEEVKVGCTLAMLQCLDRPHRLAYVLGEIMELKGPEAAEVLDVSPELFRKRLQHARASVLSFTKSYCGLASDTAPCRCDRQVASAVRDGRVNPHQLVFAGTRTSFKETRAKVREVENARWALEVHRTSHPKDSSVDFARQILESFERFDGQDD